MPCVIPFCLLSFAHGDPETGERKGPLHGHTVPPWALVLGSLLFADKMSQPRSRAPRAWPM